jgi:hypothetical protein
MQLSEKLKAVTANAQQEDDLPDFLAVRIYDIIERLQGKSLLSDDLEELIEQVVLYDTYAQTGYIGMGVNHLILEGTIGRIEDKLSGLNI